MYFWSQNQLGMLFYWWRNLWIRAKQNSMAVSGVCFRFKNNSRSLFWVHYSACCNCWHW